MACAGHVEAGANGRPFEALEPVPPGAPALSSSTFTMTDHPRTSLPVPYSSLTRAEPQGRPAPQPERRTPSDSGRCGRRRSADPQRGAARTPPSKRGSCHHRCSLRGTARREESFRTSATRVRKQPARMARAPKDARGRAPVHRVIMPQRRLTLLRSESRLVLRTRGATHARGADEGVRVVRDFWFSPAWLD